MAERGSLTALNTRAPLGVSRSCSHGHHPGPEAPRTGHPPSCGAVTSEAEQLAIRFHCAGVEISRGHVADLAQAGRRPPSFSLEDAIRADRATVISSCCKENRGAHPRSHPALAQVVTAEADDVARRRRESAAVPASRSHLHHRTQISWHVALAPTIGPEADSSPVTFTAQTCS